MQLGERGGELLRHRQIHRNRSWSRRKRSASARIAMPGYVFVSTGIIFINLQNSLL